MVSITNVAARLKREFPSDQAQLLAEELNFAHEALAKASDLTELKEIVREIGQGHQRSETRLDRIEVIIQELAEVQNRTAVKVEELTDAQKRTEEELRQLAQAQKNTQQEVGGIPNTLGYMLENEAYRLLPKSWPTNSKSKFQTSSFVSKSATKKSICWSKELAIVNRC